MTKRQGWLVLMMLAAITAALYRGRDVYIAGSVFVVLFLVFACCWFIGKD